MSKQKNKHCYYIEPLPIEQLFLAQSEFGEIENYLSTITLDSNMDLGEIVGNVFHFYRKTVDAAHLGKGWLYYSDAEKYKLLQDNTTYKYLRRKCVSEYKKISDPAIKQKFIDKMGDYISNK